MDKTLSILFGSDARVKVLRLFLSNIESDFTLDEIAKRAKVHTTTAKKEVTVLTKAGVVKATKCARETQLKSGVIKKKKVAGFITNTKFEHLLALRGFILNTAPMEDTGVLKKVSDSGKVKLLITSGVFIQEPDSRVDILVVGDTLKSTKLEAAIRELEAHIGKELRYAAFTTQDFMYRLGVYDRLVRDVLDYPHRVVVDKLGREWKGINMGKK